MVRRVEMSDDVPDFNVPVGVAMTAEALNGVFEVQRLRIAALEAELAKEVKARDEADDKWAAAVTRAEAAEAEVERLRWMLDKSYSRCHVPISAHNKAEWLADLESRWTAREEGGDE